MIARLKQRISMLATVVALSAVTLAIFDGVAEAQSFVTASATTSPEYTQNNPMPSQPTSEPTAHLVVMPGDSLWSISQGQVHPDASPQQVMHGVERIFELNRDRIGDNPNYILPGQELLLPPVSEPTTATAPTTAEPTTVVEPAVVAGASGSVAEPADLPDLPQMEAEPAALYTTSAVSSPEYYFMGVESRMRAAIAAGVGMGMIMLALVFAIIMMWRGEYGRYSENYALPVSSSDLKDALSPPSPSHADTRGPMSLVPADRSNGHSTNEHSSNKLAMVQKKAALARPETVPTSLRALEADVRRSGKTASSAILFPAVEEEYYTPPQAARVLKLSRQRITQMLKSGEMEGTQDPESGRWRIPQSVVHARLKDRPARRRRSNDEGSQSASEGSQRLMELEVEVRDLSYRLGRSEALLEFTESTLHAERDRLLEELKRERERADRLERELEEARRQ